MVALSPSHLMSPLLFMGLFLSRVTQTLCLLVLLLVAELSGWETLVQTVTQPVKMKARKDFPFCRFVLSLSPLTITESQDG